MCQGEQGTGDESAIRLALGRQNPLDYYLACETLGIPPTDPFLHEQGQLEYQAKEADEKAFSESC